jgi:YegS/Rv2252/BmrU family lipid kinase
MADNQKISFVLHGKIHGKSKILRSIEHAFSDDFELGFYETRKARHAEELATQALKDGCDYLIAVGGDGTLNEVVNGFLKSGGRKKNKAVVGVLPFGTGNDFVRTIGMNKSVGQLRELIKSASIRDIDAGRIIIGPENDDQKIVFFNNVADAGFGAEVVSEVNGVHLRKKILGGTLTFFIAVFLKFFTYRHKRMRISWDGFAWEGRVLALVVANGRFFGSGYGIAPDARIDDGKFQIVLAGNVTMIDYFKNFGNLRKSRHIKLNDLSYHHSDHVVVETLGDKILIEADGEIHGIAPLRFECLKGVLPFLIPGDVNN